VDGPVYSYLFSLALTLQWCPAFSDSSATAELLLENSANFSQLQLTAAIQLEKKQQQK